MRGLEPVPPRADRALPLHRPTRRQCLGQCLWRGGAGARGRRAPVQLLRAVLYHGRTLAHDGELMMGSS